MSNIILTEEQKKDLIKLVKESGKLKGFEVVKNLLPEANPLEIKQLIEELIL